MRNGIELVDILDKFLKEKKLSRRQFCALTDIPNSTIGTWKSKNVMPSVDLVAKVAKFMNVSLDWLVYGEIFENEPEENNNENPYSRVNIQYRMEIIMRELFKDKIPDTTRAHDSRYLHELFLNDIVEFDVFENWVLGRGYISDNVLPMIAKKLEVPLQWILTQDGYNQEDFDPYMYSLAKKYYSTLRKYNSVEEEDQKFIDNYLTSKLELRQLKSEKESNKK